jgi:DNA repair photolyase
LETIARNKFPVHIITKGSLVERDADIIQSISTTYAAVSLTITTVDDALSVKTEPGASKSSERFRTIEKLAKLNIYCGVILTPVLPFLTDTAENISGIVKRAKESGASYILAWMGMTQREGQREYYYDKLDRHFPGIKQKYIARYGDAYNCPVPGENILYEEFFSQCRQFAMPTQMRFYKPETHVQLGLFE